MEQDNFKWMDDEIKDVPNRKFLFNLMRLFLFRFKRSIKYKEMYLILRTLYKDKKKDVSKTDMKALAETVEIYKYNNKSKI